MERHGWTLLFHECLIEQLRKLEAAVSRAQIQDSKGFTSNANVKLFDALTTLIFDVIPSDPHRDVYLLGNTMGPAFRHWRRAKIGRRFRLFFRFDSKSRIIIFAWINDKNTLRASGAKTDPYVVFQRMLQSGHPPDDWAALLMASKTEMCPTSNP
ncbi:MAG: type II toxin-antitoxin system YhaV family toxin [Deltaproteobacteria bacterium]|nr:type II toxin-antitoxin system YhaV family toxin [Deltaproteobacteria bacterium]